MTPTQAQIEAAAKAAALTQYKKWDGLSAVIQQSYIEIAKAAITAAAEVGESSPQQRERLQDQYIRNTTIERCAQVAKDKATELFAEKKRNGDDGTLQGRASVTFTIYHAIRALKDQP